MNRVVLLLFFAILSLQLALAHGDVRQAIALLSELIAKYPDDSALYVKRGELHRQRMDWTAALADFGRAVELKPELVAAVVGRGLSLLGSGHAEQAVAALSRAVELAPENLVARMGRARALARNGSHRSAAADFDFVLAHTPYPQPEHYLERAAAVMSAGDRQEEAALRGLDEGIARLGPLVTLELMAIDLEVKLGAYDAGLVRLDAIAAAAERKENWLVRRGEILESAGRHADARAAYLKALTAIQELPEYRRRNRAVKALEMQVRDAWARLSTRAAGGNQ